MVPKNGGPEESQQSTLVLDTTLTRSFRNLASHIKLRIRTARPQRLLVPGIVTIIRTKGPRGEGGKRPDGPVVQFYLGTDILEATVGFLADLNVVVVPAESPICLAPGQEVPLVDVEDHRSNWIVVSIAVLSPGDVDLRKLPPTRSTA